MGGGRLRIICGPTAAGKSSIALELAERYGASIISADSRQIYRGFDIGTAKPSQTERAMVPHFGIDIANPTQRYSAAEWAREAEEKLAQHRRQAKPAIVVGGTGLYIRALVDPLFSAEPFDMKKRDELARELDSLPLSELRRWCQRLDPLRAHLGRTQLLRAIETALLQGRRLSSQHAADKGNRGPVDAVYLVVDPGPALALRIERRVDLMLDSGWLAEVEGLTRAVPTDAPAWKASGYRVMRGVLQKETDLSSAKQRVIIETRQYAKRQRTWFRHQLPPAAVTRVNPDDPNFRAITREWWENTE